MVPLCLRSISMGSRAKQGLDEYEIDLYDDSDDFYDVDADLRGLARKINTEDWENFFGSDIQMTARRHIERKRDYMKLRSELDEWEQFGDSAGW